MTFEDYLRVDALNSTALKNILTSPRLYRWRRDQPLPDKDALLVGRATHTAVFEPDRFLLDYVAWRGKVRRGKKWDEFQAMHAGQTILTLTQYQLALHVRDAVRAHPVASAILSERGECEHTVTWEHRGRRFKARLDWLGQTCWADLKSTRDPEPRRFQATAARLHYPLQFAIYSYAVESLGLDLPCRVIAAQTVEPFDVAVYDVPRAVIDFGRAQLDRAMDTLEECERLDRWPGIAEDETITFEIPSWADPSFDDDFDLTMGGLSVAV